MTLHQVLKLPTPSGVKTVYEEQPIAKTMPAFDKVIQVPAVSTSKNTDLNRKEKSK